MKYSGIWNREGDCKNRPACNLTFSMRNNGKHELQPKPLPRYKRTQEIMGENSSTSLSPYTKTIGRVVYGNILSEPSWNVWAQKTSGQHTMSYSCCPLRDRRSGKFTRICSIDNTYVELIYDRGSIKTPVTIVPYIPKTMFSPAMTRRIFPESSMHSPCRFNYLTIG